MKTKIIKWVINSKFKYKQKNKYNMHLKSFMRNKQYIYVLKFTSKFFINA